MEYAMREKATIHQVTTMPATSENVLFPGYNNQLTTGTDDPTLWLLCECQRVKGHQYRWLHSKHASIVPVPASTGLVPYIPYTVNQYWPGTIPVPSCRYLQSTGKYLLAWYLLDPGTPVHPHVTGKYLLTWYRFAISIPVPTLYWQISSSLVQICYYHTSTNTLPACIFWPVTFCPQHTGTDILPVNIFWPSTNLLSAYWYQHLTSKIRDGLSKTTNLPTEIFVCLFVCGHYSKYY